MISWPLKRRCGAAQLRRSRDRRSSFWPRAIWFSSFPRWPEQVVSSSLTSCTRGSSRVWSDHPGVAFVMVCSDAHGPMVVGHEGLHVLRNGKTEGDDPLSRTVLMGLATLLRTAGFANVPDIIVMSAL